MFRYKVIIIILVCVLLVSGCNSNREAENTTESLLKHSLHSEDSVSTDQYRISFDKNNQTINVTTKDSEVFFPLIRDVFPVDDIIWKFTVYQNDCYILLTEKNKTGFKIIRVDLTDFSTSMEFSNITTEQAQFYEERFIDEEEALLKLMELMKSYYGIFVNENSIYVVDSSEKILLIKRSDNYKIEIIAKNAKFPDSVGLYEDNIYYANAFSRLTKYESSTNEISYVGEIYTTDYKIIDDIVYFKDEMNDNKEASYNLSSNK